MTTQSTSKTQPSVEATFEHIKDINESMFDAARKAAIQSLDTYEKAIDRAIDIERKLADSTKQEWLKTMIDAQADIAKDMTHAYTTTARSILK